MYRLLFGSKLTKELSDKIAKQAAEKIATSIKPDAVATAEIQAKATIEAAYIGKKARITASKIRTAASFASAAVGVMALFLYVKPIKDELKKFQKAQKKKIAALDKVNTFYYKSETELAGYREIVGYVEGSLLPNLSDKATIDAYHVEKKKIISNCDITILRAEMDVHTKGLRDTHNTQSNGDVKANTETNLKFR